MYLLSSVQEATSMNRAQLESALKPYILYPPLRKWSKGELVSVWLERFGIKELEGASS